MIELSCIIQIRRRKIEEGWFCLSRITTWQQPQQGTSYNFHPAVMGLSSIFSLPRIHGGYRRSNLYSKVHFNGLQDAHGSLISPSCSTYCIYFNNTRFSVQAHKYCFSTHWISHRPHAKILECVTLHPWIIPTLSVKITTNFIQYINIYR